MEMTGCFFYPTPLKNGSFILHNPLYSNSFPSLYSHELFDLIEAYRNPTYSYLQNNIINRYILFLSILEKTVLPICHYLYMHTRHVVSGQKKVWL